LKSKIQMTLCNVLSISWIRLLTYLILTTLCVLLGGLAACSFKSSNSPGNPVIARDIIKSIVPSAWKEVKTPEIQIDMTAEFFPHPHTQTLALVGPQACHTRWTDHKGNEHIEDLSKECILLWIVPSNFKPKFPSLLDRMAGGTLLPTLIFSSDRICVYGDIICYGARLDRIREIGKEASVIKTDDLKPSWKRWEADIKAQLGGTSINTNTSNAQPSDSH
jgi:hypothetical protein